MQSNHQQKIQALIQIALVVFTIAYRSCVASSAITLVLLLWVAPAIASGVPVEILPIRLSWRSVWLLWLSVGCLCAVACIIWQVATQPILKTKEGSATGALYAPA